LGGIEAKTPVFELKNTVHIFDQTVTVIIIYEYLAAENRLKTTNMWKIFLSEVEHGW
jgi:hypothetical protein